MKTVASKIQITSFDDLFNPTTPDENEESKGQIREIPLADLHEFRNHPFKILDDDKMAEMVDSIRQYGVLVPGIVRERAEGGYEIVAGHRRKHASELAGKETMPVIVQELDDDEATIIMVDSNIQREELLPSEKAWAYKLKLDAMKRQVGRRSEKNDSQVGNHFSEKLSSEILAEQVGQSKNQIFRYIRLTELLPELMDMVDAKKIALNPAYELSFLTKEEQAILLEVIRGEDISISLLQAGQLKKLSQENSLTEETVLDLLCEKKAAPIKITLQEKKIRKYFPASYTQQQVEDIIFELLEQWSAQHKDQGPSHAYPALLCASQRPWEQYPPPIPWAALTRCWGPLRSSLSKESRSFRGGFLIDTLSITGV